MMSSCPSYICKVFLEKKFTQFLLRFSSHILYLDFSHLVRTGLQQSNTCEHKYSIIRDPVTCYIKRLFMHHGKLKARKVLLHIHGIVKLGKKRK